MRAAFRCLTGVAGLVIVILTAVSEPALAQELPQSRRPRREPPATFIERPGLEQNQEARRFFGGPREENAEEKFSDESTESIALTLWILRVGEPVQPPADELSGNLAERVGNLPPVIGSVNEVRELVGQMKVAGLARSAREYRLVTLNGQSVTAQHGRKQPRIVATNRDPRAGRMNTITMEPLGTQVEMRPRIDAGSNIVVSVKIGESELEKSTEVVIAEPADGSPVFADVVTTRQFNSAVSLKNNTAVLLQSIAATGPDADADDETELVILGAAVVSTSE